MNYAQGSFGRVFLVKFGDGDDLLAGLKQVASMEKVQAGVIMLIGALRSCDIVTGPKEAVIPPEPVWTSFSDGREVVAIGTIFRHHDDPVIHLHGALGRGDETLSGCIRKNSSVYLVIEAVIAEIAGIDARKTLDQATGLVTLEL